MVMLPTPAFDKAQETLLTFLEKELSQKLTSKQYDEIKKAMTKVHCQLGENIPRETVKIPSKANKTHTWEISFYSNNYRSVLADIRKSSCTSWDEVKVHQLGILLVGHSLELILDRAPVMTLYEAGIAIGRRKVELGLSGAADPMKMLEIAVKDGSAGDVMNPNSPLYTYDQDNGLITVSYEHMTFQQPTVATRDYYRVITEIPLYPTLIDYGKSNIVIDAEKRSDVTSGYTHADNITELLRLISGYFPVTVDSALVSLKELLDNNKSSDGLFQLQGYSVPILRCDGPGYWSANFAQVVLAKELVEEIILFNTDIPLSTKGEIIEEIVGFPPEPTFLTEITNAVNQVFHSTRAEVGGITMRYSKTTGNVIIKEHKVNEHKTWLFRVSEKSIEIDTDPTLRDFLTVPDIDIATWTERNEPGTFSVLGGMENLLNECIGHGVSSTQPFVDLMSSNTVIIGDTIFKVLSSYHPTVRVYSPKGTSLYLLTKDLIEKLYDLKRNPPMSTIHQNDKFEMESSSSIPDDDFNRILQDINKATGLALSAAGINQVYIAFTKLYKHRNNPEYNGGIDLPLYRRTNGDKLGLSIMYNDQTKSEIVCSIIDITSGSRTVIHPAVTILALPENQELKNSSPVSEGFIKEAFKARRIHNLVKKLETTGSPEEAYDLIVEFLGDDYEQEGSVKYKDVKIKYLIDYSKHNGQVKLDVSVIDIQDQRNDEPVFALLVRFKRESVHRVYESIKRLVEMCQ